MVEKRISMSGTYNILVAERIRNRIKELEEELRQIYRSVSDEVERLEREIEERGEAALEGLKALRGRLHELRSRMLSARLELRRLLREARLSLPPDEVEELKEEVGEFVERWEDALEDLADAVRELTVSAVRLRRRAAPLPDVGRIIEQSFEQATKGLEAALARLKEALERGAGGPSFTISVRLPQRDLEVVDALVEAGVFRSRSEAVAFFAHKGIEDSKPLFKDALAKLEELKALREKLREELKKAFEGQQGS